jgi:exodeoxyribonuclease V beta subunit
MSGFVPFQALMASAGSGKTFSLVVRYLGLLFMGEKPEEIVALTFTNKAANEMQERMIETLTHLHDRDELGAIAEVCGVSEETILQRRPEVLRCLLSADTKVMTIDSFFAKVLRKFALHAGIMPNFGTFESQHELKVMARFLRLCEIEGKENTLVSMAQISAKRVSDIFGLLDALYAKAPQLQHLHFEAEAMAPHEAKAMQLHASLLKCFEGKALSARGAKALQADSVDALIAKTWVLKPSLEYWDFKKHYEPQMDGLLRELQTALREYMRAKEQTFFAHLFELLDLYKSAKLTVAKEDSELSFDDITALVHYLLKERIDRDFLYFRLDSRISHLLLDEFQDTSVLQFEILQPLVEEMVSGSGVREHHSFFLVGDVKQSIYRFRGGAKELFGTVTEGYGLTVDSLRTNWRSSTSVVAFVNETFRGRIDGYEDQLTKPKARPGYVEVREDEALLERMTETVQRLIGLGARLGEIAVLTATNKDGSAVQETLSEVGVDVVTETTSKLINQRRVRGVIEYLKYCYFGEAVYARNFCALADIDAQTLPRPAAAFDRPAEAVRALIERYGLFDGDLNVIRFLELAERFRDLEAFLFEYERIDTKAVTQENEGVRVLTIHKSKGLEYPYVIVLDRLGRKRADTAPIIYAYDGIRLENLFLRQKNRIEFDPAYAGAIEREAALATDDALNALYVAFTRARENLYVIRKPKESVFELLALEPMTLGSEAVMAAVHVKKEQTSDIPYVPLALGRQSEVVQTEAVKTPEEPFAVTYGLALHYALEMMAAFDSAALESAMIAVSNRYGALLDASVLDSIRGRIGRLLEHAEFRELAGGEIAKEQPLMYGGELRYLDLLVRHDDRWVVIDYKSARRFEEAHREQVGFYVKAVEAITDMDVEGYLCYLLDAQVELVKV